jgi:hypothetical protein
MLLACEKGHCQGSDRHQREENHPGKRRLQKEQAHPLRLEVQKDPSLQKEDDQGRDQQKDCQTAEERKQLQTKKVRSPRLKVLLQGSIG